MKENKLLCSLISFFIIFSLAIPVSSTVAFVAPEIEIYDWYDLDAIRYNLGGSYFLMNDLDSTTAGYGELASPTANGGKGWQPIGTFTGSFDGQGYEISDLFIDRPDEDYAGLFGLVGMGGVIQDVGAVDADVTGYRYVSGLVGENEGTVSNSYATGSVTGEAFVGGLVGINYGIVSNSYSTGSVNGKVQVGGLVGRNHEGIVGDSYSTASVTGDTWIGGLVGSNSDESTVSDSYATGSISGDEAVGGLVGYNLGTVSNSYSTGSVTGNAPAGGLVGLNEGTVRSSYSMGSVVGEWGNAGGLVGRNENAVSNSYSTGSVAGNYYVGGLIGSNGPDGTVSNSYSTGSVTGGEYVGGLVGGNDGTVSNSYSIGSVAGDGDVGGLVGLDLGGAVSNSFWDTQTSGQATSAGGTGKTTTEMKSITTFTGWDIIAVTSGQTNPAYTWNIIDGGTYPFLSWEQPREPQVVQYTLTISSTAGGSVTTPGEGTFTYDAGTVVSLVATKASGYGFVNWAGDVDTIANVNAATTTITIQGDYEITARFMAGVVDAKTERVKNDTIDATEEADTEVRVTGTATVTVAGYDENPGGVPPVASPDQPDWEPLGKYTDVYVPDTKDVTELEIKLYYTDDEAKDFDEESLRLFWWNGTAWVQCSDSGVNTESNYMWAKIRTSTIPSLTDLQGTPWGGYGHPSSAPKPICFIATAAYGTDTAKEIDILREFRDKVLLPKSLGAEFVSFYYKTSPPIANFISQHEVLKTAVRLGFVDPIVKILDWSHDLWSARGSQ